MTDRGTAKSGTWSTALPRLASENLSWIGTHKGNPERKGVGSDADGRRFDPTRRTASCGNMFTAAAIAGLSLLPYTTLFTRARSGLPRLFPNDPDSPLLFPLSILSASNGVLMRARVPIDPYSLELWEPFPGEGAEIAGVPGRDEPGVMVEMPLDGGAGAEGGLVTGNLEDKVRLGDGTEVTVSIVSSGLPNIFLPISSLREAQVEVPDDLLALPASTLSANAQLCHLLENIRTTAAAQFSIPLSLASPKITLVGPIPPSGYKTTAGGTVKADGEADLLVRAISSGDWHATIPGTTLGALNVAAGTRGTVVHELMPARAAAVSAGGDDKVVTVRAAHAAGVAESSVRFARDGTPESVVMVRTAREIMRGEVMIPERVLSSFVSAPWPAGFA
jgi:2-methylaconitate cis-trans-isomerase PrpF